MLFDIRMSLVLKVCRVFILIALPLQAMEGEQVTHPIPEGPIDFTSLSKAAVQTVSQVPNQGGLHIDVSYNPMHPNGPVPHSLTGWIAKSISDYVSRPFSTTAKIVGGAAVLAGYALLKSCLGNHPALSRVVNIGLNGLSVLSGLHVLKATSKKKPELVPGVLGLLVGASPIIVSDTLALKSGRAGLYENLTGHIGSRYMHGVTEGMRALGVLYVAGQCVSWVKNKIIDRCNACLK